MGKEELIEALNRDLSLELASIVQYMWHSVMAIGIGGLDVSGLFRKFAIQEMMHAEQLAERIRYLGGSPVSEAAEIQVGGTLKEMIKDDLDAERGAINIYRNHIKLAEDVGDVVTKNLLEGILSEEEKHDAELSALLEG